MSMSPIGRLTRAAIHIALAIALSLGLPGAKSMAADRAVRVGMIPDAGATQVSVAEKAPLSDYLSKAIERPVELIIPTNYNATVEALGNGSLDFAYLGGLTYIKAQARYGVLPLVQRDSDVRFHSLFITRTDAAIHALADLKGKAFAFGDINSTSGHLMPCDAMVRADIDPDRDITYRYTGSHPATAKAVETGAVDAGALDESVYNAMIADGKLDQAKVRVFFTTPDFVDYVWVARKDVDPAIREKFAAAFLELRDDSDAQILTILRGKKFIRANDGAYDTLRRVAAERKLF